MFRNFFIACALVALPTTALAASTVATTFGPRVGFSSGPDQFVVGCQAEIAEIAPSLSFNPSLEIGIGDHLTLVGINFDLHYAFDTRTTWRPYVGVGASLNSVNLDESRGSDTWAGGSLLGGAVAHTRSGNLFFGELKLGLGDTPDLKLMVGWNFKM